MTVKELMLRLAGYQSDMEVVVDGYEGDYVQNPTLHKKLLCTTPLPNRFFGDRHEWSSTPNDPTCFLCGGTEAAEVLVLSRGTA